MKIKIHTTRPGRRGLGICQRGASASGFTLIETIVATVISAMLLPTLYACIGAGFSMMQVTRESLRATQIMIQRMEAVRLASYQAVQDQSAFPTNVTEYYSPGGQANGSGGTAYKVAYSCAPGPSGLPPSYRSNIVLVTVTASWNSGKLKQVRSMQSYVTRYGVQRYVSAN